MSFLARLATDLITVEAGATTPASIEIINRGDASDQFEVSIEGLDPEWTAVPVPVVTIPARESQDEKLFFKPPRVSESSAGNYPFVLKVRSLTTGEARSVQGVLTVKPYHHLSVEMSPKKGFISPLRRQNTFDATLINLGNTEHTLQLFGSDPEEACAFEFDQEQVQVGPGQQKTVLVTVNPTKRSVLSGSRLFGFSVSARSIEQPSIVAVAQAQLEQRPLMSLGTLVGVVIAFCILGLWIYLIPAKPTMKLSVDKSELIKGDTLTVTWSTTGQPGHIHLSAGNQSFDSDNPGGTWQFVPQFSDDTPTTSLDIVGEMDKDGHQYPAAKELHIIVREPAPVADPKIDVFKPDKTKLFLGDTITIGYHVTNAVKVVLLPMGTVLDPTLDQTQVTVNDLNIKEYKLVAYNSVGKTDTKSVRVSVSQASKAKIIAFTATPNKLDGEGDVQLTWQVTNAVRIELASGGETRTVDGAGPLNIHLTKDTVITLTAYDDAGVTTSQSIKITVKPPTLPTDPVPPTNDPASTNTTTGGVDGTVGR